MPAKKKGSSPRYQPGEFPPVLWIRLLLLFLGTGGILSFIDDLDRTAFRRGPVLLLTFVTGLLLWYTWYHLRLAAFILTGAELLFAVLVYRRRQALLLSQFQHIADVLMGTGASGTVDITEAVELIGVLLVLVLFYLEFAARDPGIFYAVTILLLFLGPFIGMDAGFLTVFLLGSFQVLFLFYRWLSRKKVYGKSGRSAISLKSAICLMLLFLTAFLVLRPLASSFSSSFYGIVSGAQGRILNGTHASRGGAQPIIDGSVSRDNNYPTGQNQIRIVVDQKPDETLYLKSFTGGSYTENGWEAADESAIMDRIARDMRWESGRMNPTRDMLGSMFFYANLGSGESAESNIRQLSIFRVSPDGGEEGSDTAAKRNRSYGSAAAFYTGRDSFQDQYAPYFSASYLWSYERNGDGDRPGYFYFEEKDMHVDWENAWKDYPGYVDTLRNVLKFYEQESEDYYTAVPEDLLPRLTELSRENPEKSLDDITAFILYTLHNNTSYTRTPGLSPVNQDIVESFLFERKKGYCVHYASAATLLYRLYGIPSRYAAGYMARPEDFKEQEDGTWEAVLTDLSAHSWTEIFMEDYGWVPVDMTPAEGNISAVSYPGFDTGRLNTLLAEHEWNISTENQPASSSGSSSDGSRTDALPKLSPVRFIRDHFGLFSVLLAILIYTAVLFPFLRDYQRLRRLEKLNVRQIFSLLLDMLHRYGYLLGYSGNESDFAARLSDSLRSDDLTEAECRKMTEIVNRSAFSGAEPTEEETWYVKGMYRKISAFVSGKLSPARRFLFRFIHRYG